MRLYDSLEGKRETFTNTGDPVKLYVCGITPYASTHLGHIFTYSASDVLVRHLKYQGFSVRYVQNLTDIDDPILRESKEQEEDWRELGLWWTRRYIDEMKTLNVSAPDDFPRASEVIDSIQETSRRLIQAGVAYEAGGSVFFDVDEWKEFGKLSRLPRDRMLEIANERGNHPDDPRKRNPLDFPLWQAQEAGEPWWDSPWGPGRPGWHIECSTMASRFLGDTIDIHGGGADLEFPHHETEIAQSEAASGKRPFVRCWFHIAMVRHEGEKMSKSLGNLIMVEDLLDRFSPDGLRLYLARHHYREPWSYDAEALASSEELAKKLRSASKYSREGGSAGSRELNHCRKTFVGALDDDLDTPRALAIVEALADETVASDTARSEVSELLREFGNVLGLRLSEEPDEEVRRGWDRHLSDLGKDS
jgi:L-cysteine:1D-myo-inositol 2-amino-2-deoxy-alpha-D-glucopyranoside ligase